MDEAQAYYADESKAPGAIEMLDKEIEALSVSVEDLARRLGPVSNQYGTVERLSEPRPEPSSQLRGRAERVSGITERIRGLIRDLDL